MHSLQHHYNLAERAYSGSSFDPEKRAANVIKEHENLLNTDLAGVPENYHAKYIQKFENWTAKGKPSSVLLPIQKRVLNIRKA